MLRPEAFYMEEMMKKTIKSANWIAATVLGSGLFSLGFSLFLLPNDINTGGVSGLSQVIVHLTGFGTVGTVTLIINMPLFLLGGFRMGKRFIMGSLLGMVLSGVFIDCFSMLSLSPQESVISAVYGGLLCGLGLGMVFASGTSTGGSDILVRLLKLRYRNIPIGTISMCFDTAVVILTGCVFRDLSKALYSGVSVFITGQMMDLVIYRFDNSRVALIISDCPERIAAAISDRLDRGATYLHSEGAYRRKPLMVILAVVKRRQLAELKELVMELDEKAFVIVQDAHQVLGDGFTRYSRNGL